MREGQLLKKIYDKMYPSGSIDTELLFISRKSLWSSSINNKKEITDFIKVYYGAIKADYLNKLFNTTYKDDKILTQFNIDELNLEHVIESSQNNRENLMKYLTKIGLVNNDKVIMVDIGYGMTSQYLLSKILDKYSIEIHGLYICTLSHNKYGYDITDLISKGFLCDRDKVQELSDLFLINPWIEECLMGPRYLYSTIGYDKRGNPIFDNKSQDKTVQGKEVQIIQESIMKSVEDSIEMNIDLLKDFCKYKSNTSLFKNWHFGTTVELNPTLAFQDRVRNEKVVSIYQVNNEVLRDKISYKYHDSDSVHFLKTELFENFDLQNTIPNINNIINQSNQSTEIKEQLRRIAKQCFNLKSNIPIEIYKSLTKCNSDFLIDVLKTLVNEVTKNILKLLEKSKTQVRLLSRDMNIFYYNIIARCYQENTELLKRIKFINLSRPISEILDDSNVHIVTRLSEDDVTEASHVYFIDIGYSGSIPERLHSLFKSVFKHKFSWIFLWKSRQLYDDNILLNSQTDIEFHNNTKIAPKYIEEMNLTKFYNYAERIRNHITHNYTCFRVNAIEHQEKWTTLITDFQKDVTYIMLDIDDTFLKDVSIENEGRRNVQVIEYSPSHPFREKYKKRLKAKNIEEGKVIHYQFIDNVCIKSTVVLRPSMNYLFKQLEPLIKLDRVKVLITSSNDIRRSETVYKQIKFSDGRTLYDYGCEVVDPKLFMIEDEKHFSLLRKNLDIPDGSLVISIDDVDVKNNCEHDELKNIKIKVPKYTRKMALDEIKYDDNIMITYAIDSIYNSIFEFTEKSIREKMLVISKIMFFMYEI